MTPSARPTPRRTAEAMCLIGIAGWSGSGKTTLIERLIPCLARRGIAVSTVKHAHHAFDVDKPGKDSFRHRQAGARDVLVASAARFALMREHRGNPEPELSVLRTLLAPVDVVLVEGFKRTAIPKIEIHRGETGKPLLQHDDPWIVAVAADTTPPGLTVPCLSLDDVEGVADVILALLAAPAHPAPQRARDIAASDGPDLSVADVLSLLARETRPVCGPAPEAAVLQETSGRVLATDVRTPVALPPADCAAVDGYAFAHGDLLRAGPTWMRVSGRAAAGRPLAGAVETGSAIRIFTGAVLPPGTDTVVMQEDTTLDQGQVRIPAGVALGINRRRSGEDAAAGSIVLERGTRLGPRHIALAAACGIEALPVLRQLKVALFSTGDELATEGGGSDSNRPMLAAMLRRLGVIVLDQGILRDNATGVRDALERAAGEADLLVTTGGMSVGEEDHVRNAVSAIGHLDLWRVAMKPGRPLALGWLGATRFLGLPGSPVAAFIGFVRFGMPLVLGLAGAKTENPLSLLRAGFSFNKKAGRTEYLRVRVAAGVDGLPTATLEHDHGAGRLAHLARADALVELGPEVTGVVQGDIVTAIMLNDVTG